MEILLVLSVLTAVSGEADPAPSIQLIDFDQLFKLTQDGGQQHVREDRSLLKTFPFHQGLGLNALGNDAQGPVKHEQINEAVLSRAFHAANQAFSGLGDQIQYGPAGSPTADNSYAGQQVLSGFGGHLAHASVAQDGYATAAGRYYAGTPDQLFSAGLAGLAHNRAAAPPAISRAAAPPAISSIPASTFSLTALPTGTTLEKLGISLGDVGFPGSGLRIDEASSVQVSTGIHQGPADVPGPQVVNVVSRQPVRAGVEYAGHAALPAAQLLPVPARKKHVPATAAARLDESEVHLQFNPNRARKPSLGRAPYPVLEVVAAVQEKCIDKLEYVEEIEYPNIEKCDHQYEKKCHTSYSTEYTNQQEVECEDNYKKECQITYSPSAHNETVRVCSRPLVKDCNIQGPVQCRTEYMSECWSKLDEHTVIDDVPDCQTIYEEKCHEDQVGYTTEQKCSKWPREVCTVNKKLKTKSTPQTKCEKVPQEFCSPVGCGFAEGPEQCIDKIKTIIVEIPSEVCDLQPRSQCDHVTKLVPKLLPVEECVDVPKEICSTERGAPIRVQKPISKKWCYTPSPESGLLSY